MGKCNTAKYERDDLIRILLDLGFEVDSCNGKHLGKGDHIVYAHSEYDDIKVNVPRRKSLNENEMSDICSSLVLILYVLDIDTSNFKKKNGVEGKLVKALNNSKKDIRILYTQFTKRCLGLKDEEDYFKYIEETKQKLKESKAKKKS